MVLVSSSQVLGETLSIGLVGKSLVVPFTSYSEVVCHFACVDVCTGLSELNVLLKRGGMKRKWRFGNIPAGSFELLLVVLVKV